jgi:Protein of unknown function (DUF1573)
MTALLSCWIIALAGQAAELSFTEPTASAGSVYTGVPLTHRFEFQNVSPYAIRITGVHTHCGCTTSKLTKLIYQPGERGALDLDVQTLTQPAGPQSFSAHVEFEVQGAQREAEVALKADLISELMLDPAKLVVPADHVDQHPFTLRETRPASLQIIDASTSSPHVKVRMTEPKKDEKGGWTRSLYLVVEPELAAGTHEARLDLYTTDPKYGHLQAPFVLVKKSADQVSFSPRELDISGPPGRPLPSRVIVLRTSSEAKMQIDSIAGDHPAITARWAANAEGVVAVRVQLDPARLTQPSFDSAIHIHLTQPQTQTITVPVHFKQED